MKKIASVGDYDIFEVVQGDADHIVDMFPGPWTDAASRILGNGDDVDADHMWYDDVELSLRAIEGGREKDYLERYPYEDGMSEWDRTCLLHPLFLISAKKDAKYKNILFSVPPTEMEASYYTDNGEYWGDLEWEPLPDIIGDEEVAADILETIYDYIAKAKSPLEESRISRNAATARRRFR